MRSQQERELSRTYITHFKLIPLWQERFGWACVVSWSEMWSELPIEINALIVQYLVETHYKCLACPTFVPKPIAPFFCSEKCSRRLFNPYLDEGRIIGRAIQYAEPAEEINILWGHYNL